MYTDRSDWFTETGSPFQKEQDRIRPHMSKVKRVRQVSWILPTKMRAWRFIIKKKITFVLKNIPKARAIYGTNIKIYNIILNK